MGYLWVHSARARTTGGGLAAEGGGGVSSAPWWRCSGGVVMWRFGPEGSVGGEEASWGAKSGPCVGGTAVPWSRAFGGHRARRRRPADGPGRWRQGSGASLGGGDPIPGVGQGRGRPEGGALRRARRGGGHGRRQGSLWHRGKEARALRTESGEPKWIWLRNG